LEPATPDILFALDDSEDCAGAMDEQGTKVPIPALGHAEERCLPAGGMLPGDETHPGGELAPILEPCRIPDGRDQGGRRQGANPGQLHQPLAGFVGLTQLRDLVVRGSDPLIQGLQLLGEGLEPGACHGRQAVLGLFEDEGQGVPDLGGPLRDDEAIFGQQPADLID
jgi:hypothetical protein